MFAEAEQKELDKMENGLSLMDLIEKWLERTPFLKFEGFDFLKEYRKAVKNMHDKEKASINETSFISDEEKAIRLKMLTGTETYFDEVFDEKKHKRSDERR